MAGFTKRGLKEAETAMQLKSKYSIIVLLLIGSLIMISCSVKNYEYADIEGNWWGLEHIIDGESQDKSNRIWFGFKADSTYSSVLLEKQKAGTYTIDGNTILAKPNAENAISMRIESIRDDIMILHLTSGGTQQTLILTKNN